MADLSRRAFLTRGVPGRLAALLAGGVTATPAAAAGAPAPPRDDVSARDLRKMSRAEVGEALRRIRARWRTRR
jgi:hypothetical protein